MCEISMSELRYENLKSSLSKKELKIIKKSPYTYMDILRDLKYLYKIFGKEQLNNYKIDMNVYLRRLKRSRLLPVQALYCFYCNNWVDEYIPFSRMLGNILIKDDRQLKTVSNT